MARKITTDIFIQESNIVHNNKYDYSKTVYRKSLEKVVIICTEHGEFYQLPNNHLNNKQGCPSCSKSNKYSVEQFLGKANKIHGDKYIYYRDFINFKTKIKIKCKICDNIFYKTPDMHLNQKQGCSKCSLKNMTKSRTEFINQANKIHGEKYEYGNYKNGKTKIQIICPEHGEFYQLPESHLNSQQGCPKCNMSKGERLVKGILEENSIQYITQKVFNNCRNKSVLPFDFYLPDYNILIEYDGKQHFEAIDYFGGEKTYNYIKNNDTIKNQYCKDNNINLIRIDYKTKKNKIIENILRGINEKNKKGNWCKKRT